MFALVLSLQIRSNGFRFRCKSLRHIAALFYPVSLCIDFRSMFSVCTFSLGRFARKHKTLHTCSFTTLQLATIEIEKKNNDGQFVQTFDLKRSNTQQFLQSEKNHCLTQPQARNELNSMFTKHCGILTSLLF